MSTYTNSVEVPFSELLGKTIIKITSNNRWHGDIEEVVFYTEDGFVYIMLHDQQCCEYVYLHDIDGEFTDILNSPILVAEEVSNGEEHEYNCAEWTFYKLGTKDAILTMRWLGESNGYYSTDVSFLKQVYVEYEENE